MTLSQQELACLFRSINVAPKTDDRSRQFQFADLGIIGPLAEKLGRHVKDGRLMESSYEIEFSTEEKMKIKGYIEEHEWSAGDANFVLSLVEKLK